MRVWVVGSQCFVDYEQFVEVFSHGLQALGCDELEGLMTGYGTRGVDNNVSVWATINKVPFERASLFTQDDFRKSYAMRLQKWRIAKYVDALVALWDGKSEAVATSILAAHREELPVYVRTIRQPKIHRGVHGRPRNEVRDADRK